MESFTGVIRPDKDAGSVDVHRARPSAASTRRGSKSATRRRWPARWSTPCPTSSTIPTAAPSRRSTASCRPSSRSRSCCDMELDLKAIREEAHQPQRPGDRRRRRARQAAGSGSTRNPVFDEAEVDEMVKAGVKRLTEMQLSDGGWGWFSGCGEHSLAAHDGRRRPRPADRPGRTTSPSCPGMLERGVAWLKSYQAEQVQLLKNAADQDRSRARSTPTTSTPSSTWCSSTPTSTTPRCATSSTATAPTSPSTPRPCSASPCTSSRQADKLAMILQNIEQFVVAGRREPDRLPASCPTSNYWWYWYGSEIEANAYYLKLLAADRPEGRARPAAGEVPAQQPQARHLLEQHPRHGPRASRRWPTTSRPAARTSPT